MPSNIVINIGAMYKKSLLNICTALRGNYLFAARKRGLNVSGANTTCVAFKGGLEFPQFAVQIPLSTRLPPQGGRVGTKKKFLAREVA